MNQEIAPIDPKETILRRVVISPGYYNPTKAPPIEAGAFRPGSNDTDGLSFFLEREISPATLAASGKSATCGYVVARLRACDIFNLGLSLLPTQSESELPGHLIIPEINTTSYSDGTKRPKIKEAMAALAKIASRDIVFTSTSEC